MERVRLLHRAPTRYVDIYISILPRNLYRSDWSRRSAGAGMLTSMPFCRLCLTSWERPGERNSSLARARKGSRFQPQTGLDPILLRIAVNLVTSRKKDPSHEALYLSVILGTHNSANGIVTGMFVLVVQDFDFIPYCKKMRWTNMTDIFAARHSGNRWVEK